MAYIFLDESGDLGFDFSKSKTTQFFVVTCVFANKQNKKSLEKIVKKVFSGLIKTPKQEKCLQIADAISWALFRKKEHGDESYANMIKSKVTEEIPLFP